MYRGRAGRAPKNHIVFHSPSKAGAGRVLDAGGLGAEVALGEALQTRGAHINIPYHDRSVMECGKGRSLRLISGGHVIPRCATST